MMNPPGLNESHTFTYRDYLQWADDERWELINDRLYNITPAPSRKHQAVLGELLRQFANYFVDSGCHVYGAPFDVRLAMGDEKDEDVANVVQPDLCIICDPSKLDDKGCKGSPDLVVEIVLPSTGRKDMKEKFLLYEKSGVKEYWIVDPEKNIVMIFQQEKDGRFGRPAVFSEEDEVTVSRFPGLTISLGSVFRA